MTQLYNHSDIHNKAVEIKKTSLTRMSSTDNFISKKTTKYNYSIGRTFFKKREQKGLRIKCQDFKVNLTKSKTEVLLAAMMAVM